MREEMALSFRKSAVHAFNQVTDLSNNDKMDCISMYDYWSPNSVQYNAATDTKAASIVKVDEGGSVVLYECIQGHVSQANWKPSQATASLWVRIDKEHAGTLEDPIPAAVNMIYYNGKYYSEGSDIYLCTRDSGIALQHMPSQLVGHYFTKVE